MKTGQIKEKILSDYQKKAEEIISQMLGVLMRAQRKADDVDYRKTLEKLDEEALTEAQKMEQNSLNSTRGKEKIQRSINRRTKANAGG